MAALEEEPPPNKSGKKPTKPLETTPANELIMDGKRSQENVTAQLKLKNSSKNKVAYKVQCNHPFMITVDKEIGFIEAGGSVTVTVTRLKFDADKYDSQGRRTSLLVQHVNVSHKADDVRKIWATVIGASSLKKRMVIKLMGADNRVLGESAKDEGSATED